MSYLPLEVGIPLGVFLQDLTEIWRWNGRGFEVPSSPKPFQDYKRCCPRIKTLLLLSAGQASQRGKSATFTHQIHLSLLFCQAQQLTGHHSVHVCFGGLLHHHSKLCALHGQGAPNQSQAAAAHFRHWDDNLLGDQLHL